MAAVETAQRMMTKEEFKQLPVGPPYYELEYGEVIEVPRPHPRHNLLVAYLCVLLDTFVRQHNLGLVFHDVDVDLTPDLTYAPDIVFIRQERAGIYAEATGEIVGVPDLAVEVVSAKGGWRDRVKKFDEYRKAGVVWYWLIDAEDLSVEEYHLKEGQYVRMASIQPGAVFRPGLFTELEINLSALLGQ